MVFTQSAKMIAAYLYQLPNSLVRQLNHSQQAQPKANRTATNQSLASCLRVTIKPMEMAPHGRMLNLQGRLTVESYQKMIEVATDLAAVGINSVIIDMTEVTEISGSGLFALYSAALLLDGQMPPDPSNGWAAYHTMAEQMKAESQPNLKLVNLQPQVANYLGQTGFDSFLEIYPDSAQAIDSI